MTRPVESAPSNPPHAAPYRQELRASPRSTCLGVVHGSREDLQVRLSAIQETLEQAGFTLGARMSAVPHSQIGFVSTDVLGRLAVVTATDLMRTSDFSVTAFAGPFENLPGWAVNLTLAAVEPPTDIHLDDADAIFSRCTTHLQALTRREMSAVRALNPITSRVAEQAVQSNRSLARTRLIVRDHLLLEKLNLFWALRVAGLRPENCWIVPKDDNTRYRARVASQLEAEGYTLVKSHELKRLEMELLTDGVPATVIVDDGGDLILRIMKGWPKTLTRPACIETTTKGMRLLREAGLDQEVADLATCELKSSLSLPIAASCVQRFRELLVHRPQLGLRCHVVGYGKLGTPISALLRAFGFQVSVSDTAPSARMRATQDGFTAYEHAGAALRGLPHDYLFACSGTPSVTLSDVLAMRSPAVLCSASSQDLRLVAQSLRTRNAQRAITRSGQWYRYDSTDILVMGEGHAINLFYAEGVPEPDYDPFTALIAAAIIEASHCGGVDPSTLAARYNVLEVSAA